MSITTDISTPVGQIRLEIGDSTEGDGYGVKPPALSNFSDDELTYFYTHANNDVLTAAARACEVLARMWAGAGQNVRIRDYSINTTQRAEHYRNLANDLRLGAGTLYRSGSAPTTKADGYSNSTNSQEVEPSSEYGQARKTTKW